MRWFEKAAKVGDGKAMSYLSSSLCGGNGPGPPALCEGIQVV